jgi:SAM-dependent methyltransferase
VEVYREMDSLEARHWWFKARREIVLAFLDSRSALEPGSRIVDLGCGTGGFLSALGDYPVTSEGFDGSEQALELCLSKGLSVKKGVLPGSIPADGRADIALMLDVLEHIEKDLDTLASCLSLVRGGGHLLLTVPAHQWLWSGHDERHHHKRRYSRSGLLSLISRSGWQTEYFTPFNTILFPAAVLLRLFGRAGASGPIGVPRPALNRALHHVFASESRMLRRGGRFPVGLSYLAWLRKPQSQISTARVGFSEAS